MKRYELTKEQWERVKAVLPAERSGKRGRPRKDDRRMRNGMLWIARSGARWRDGGTLEAPYSIVRRCGYGKPEPGLYLYQGSRKCQRRGKTADKNGMADRAYGAKTIRAYISEQCF